MIKKKQLEELGKALYDFSRFPKYINHQKVGYSEQSVDLEWQSESRAWELTLGVTTTPNGGKEMWRLAYDLVGWEGIEQSLPVTLENFYEGGGIMGDNIQECIQKMKEWLKSEGVEN